MFSSGIPAPGEVMDGTSDSNPIHLDCVTQDFDHLLSWMYPVLFVFLLQLQLFMLTRILLRSATDQSDAQDLSCYISILTLADKWDMADAKMFAKKAIVTTFWTPNQHSRLIGVAFKYDIPSWFRESFKTLVRCWVTEFSVADTEVIGLRTMMAIVKTRDAIDHHKKLLAHSPPHIIHTKRCVGLSRNHCAIAYEDLWWRYVGKALLDPQVPIQCWNVPSLMERIAPVGMGDGCLQRTRKWLANHGVLKADEDIIEGTVRKLLAFRAGA
jgi:hypothetical protein